MASGFGVAAVGRNVRMFLWFRKISSLPDINAAVSKVLCDEKSHGKNLLVPRRRGRGVGLCDPVSAYGPAGEFGLHSHRGNLHLRHRLQVLLEMDRCARACSERPP